MDLISFEKAKVEPEGIPPARCPTHMTCAWCGQSFERGPWLPSDDKDSYCSTKHWLVAVWGLRAARLLKQEGAL